MFNAELEVEKIITFIRDYFNENNLGGVVIGISGGKDSAVSAGLFCKALGSDKVIGVTMPCHSKEEDREDIMIEDIGVEVEVDNIGEEEIVIVAV